MITTAVQQLSDIMHQNDQIIKLVGSGAIDPEAVKRTLQEIIERPVRGWRYPEWWRTAEQQLERARQLWPNVVLPEPPAKGLTPWTPSEVLLLHVPDTFDNLWNKIDVPPNFEKYRQQAVDQDSLVIVPNKRVYTKPVWLIFDPYHGTDNTPDALSLESNIAATEVLSALIQFPEWPREWTKDRRVPAPNLSGCRMTNGRGLHSVPFIDRWANSNWSSGTRLEVGLGDPARRIRYRSSPTVREC